MQWYTLATCLIIRKSLKWVAHFLSFFVVLWFFFCKCHTICGISPTYFLLEIVCYFIIIFGVAVVVHFIVFSLHSMKWNSTVVIYNLFPKHREINKGINLFCIQMKTVHKLFRVHFWIEIDILWLCWMWFASDYYYLWQKFKWKTRLEYRISYCFVYSVYSKSHLTTIYVHIQMHCIWKWMPVLQSHIVQRCQNQLT